MIKVKTFNGKGLKKELILKISIDETKTFYKGLKN